MSQPHSNMPPAVRRQVKEANKLIASLNAPPAAHPAAAPALAAADPAATPAPAPAPSDLPPDLPMIDITQVAEPVVQAAPQVNEFEQRFRVIKGKYDNEVPRLQQKLNEQQEMINRLLLAQATYPAATPQPVARQLTPEEQFGSMGVSSKEVQEYGPELLNMVSRIAQGTVTPELKKLMSDTQEMKQLLAANTAAQATAARERVWSALRNWNPDWNIINNDQDFLAWLEDVDVFSGSSRKAALTSAFNTNDAARVVAIFQAYVGKTPTPTPQTAAPAVDRGTLVAPTRARGAAMEAPDSQSGRMIPEQEISDFYTRVRKKQVKPAEYEAKSQEYAVAAATGRVIPSARDFHQNAM